jgi:hypothetical protein
MLCVTAHVQAQPTKTPGFGALDVLTAEAAKTKLAAWLKDVGKSDAATTDKLNAIWKDQSRSILDRVADSLALGDPVAAKLMLEARDPGAPAPVVLPSVFKDEKRSAFFRANLGLVYARALVNRRVYEEALDTLSQFGADQSADPAAYLFHRAVCEHALQRKSEATKSITRLLEEGSSIAPERYKTVATLMLLDMHTWKNKDLGDIARKMENIERRLEIARGGPETQRQQREVLNRLDEIIKKLENQNKQKKKPGDGPPKPGDGPPMPGDGEGECPDGGQPGEGKSGPPKGTNPSKNPATDSANAGGNSSGVVETGAFKKLVSDWGRLPPAEQRRALQQLTQGMSPRHREAIINYFQNLTNPALNRK